MSNEYGIAPFSREEVVGEFSGTATVGNLREQYHAYVKKNPLPNNSAAKSERGLTALGREPRKDGSTGGGTTHLSTMMEVAVASAQYWSEYRKDKEPVVKNRHILDDPLYPEEPMSWRRRLSRFACNVVVDGVAGGLAGMGGGPVAGGIVGGLASYGADQLLLEGEG